MLLGLGIYAGVVLVLLVVAFVKQRPLIRREFEPELAPDAEPDLEALERIRAFEALGFVRRGAFRFETSAPGARNPSAVVVHVLASPDALVEVDVSAFVTRHGEHVLKTIRTVELTSRSADGLRWCTFDRRVATDLLSPRISVRNLAGQRDAAKLVAEHARHVAERGLAAVELDVATYSQRVREVHAESIAHGLATGRYVARGDAVTPSFRFILRQTGRELRGATTPESRRARFAVLGLAAIGVLGAAAIVQPGVPAGLHVALASLLFAAVAWGSLGAAGDAGIVLWGFVLAPAALAFHEGAVDSGIPWWAGFLALIFTVAARSRRERARGEVVERAALGAEGAKKLAWKPALPPVEYAAAVAIAWGLGRVIDAFWIYRALWRSLIQAPAFVEWLAMDAAREAGLVGLAVGLLAHRGAKRGERPGPIVTALAAVFVAGVARVGTLAPTPWTPHVPLPSSPDVVEGMIFWSALPAILLAWGLQALGQANGRWWLGAALATPQLLAPLATGPTVLRLISSVNRMAAAYASVYSQVSAHRLPFVLTITAALPFLMRLVPRVTKAVGIHTREESD